MSSPARAPLVPTLLVRVAIYAAVIVLAAWGYMRAVEAALGGRDGGAARTLLAEGGLLETLQVALLGLAFAMAVSPRPRPRLVVHLLMALLLAAALVRELDDRLAQLLFRHAHRVLMVGLLVAAAALGAARNGRLREQVPALLRRPGFYLLLFGTLLVGSFAQVLGSTPIWQALTVDEPASRIAKRFVEEGLEALGYLTFALAVFDARFMNHSA